eukprot:3436391-Rhodomonas_salina.2
MREKPLQTGGLRSKSPYEKKQLPSAWTRSPEFLALSNDLQELHKLVSSAVNELDIGLNAELHVDTSIPQDFFEEISGLSQQLPVVKSVVESSSLSLNYSASKKDEGDVRGIRLKFGRNVRGNFKSGHFGDSLGIPHQYIRVFESEEDPTVMFLKVQGFKSEFNTQTSEDIAWKIFGLCKDRASPLHQFNRGEVFCLHPYDIEPQHQSSLGSDGALEDCVGVVLAAGGGIEESASQVAFVRFCRDIQKDLGALDSEARYLDQLCADAMMVMEPFITTMARYKTPNFDQSALSRESTEIRDMIDQYLDRISQEEDWDDGSKQLEKTLKRKLTSHLEAVDNMRTKIQEDLAKLSLVGGRGVNKLELAEEQGLKIAKQLKNESEAQEMT